MFYKALLANILFLFLLQNAQAHLLPAAPTTIYEYEGTIGDLAIKMTFATSYNNRVTTYYGTCQYKKVGKDIELAGAWVPRSESFELVEFGGASGTVSGYFQLKYDNERVDLITGTWTSFDKKKKLLVKLNLKSEREE